ncbi:MAG: hypothetical protein A2202_02150 [Bdellovibrionales bacterium RIFOXYA1_FULL_36_14]|nr:MAG: hypothetical protein A2202_02150 [Bdellovibrionales bacterium RIFOXYA1_FULL_36_14]
MITTGISGTKTVKNKFENIAENEKVSLDTLAELTGFPKEFIQDELGLISDQITLKNLRTNMLKYLESVTSSAT